MLLPTNRTPMHDAVLQEFWRQLQLPSPPSPDSDCSIEIEGIGLVRISHVQNGIALSAFLRQGVHDPELIAKTLGMTDYRKATGPVLIHPILAADHRPGFLAMLPSGSVTPPRLMSAFETILSHLERLAG